MKKLFGLSILFIFLVSGLVFGESNGIWHKAEDVRPGTFGSDEGATSSNSFTFINKVNLTQDTVYKGTELDSRYVNVKGDSMSGTLNINSNIGRSLYASSSVDDGIAGITSATGKSAIYGFANNANAYSGYFEGGKFVVGTGNVGIGTTTPLGKLQINTDSNFPNARILLNGNDVGASYMELRNKNNKFAVISKEYENTLNIYNYESDNIQIASNAGDSVLANRKILFFGEGVTGNVGIGTTSPTQKLDVNGKIRMRSQTIMTDSADIVATKGYVDSVAGGSGADSGTLCGQGSIYTYGCYAGALCKGYDPCTSCPTGYTRKRGLGMSIYAWNGDVWCVKD